LLTRFLKRKIKLVIVTGKKENGKNKLESLEKKQKKPSKSVSIKNENARSSGNMGTIKTEVVKTY